MAYARITMEERRFNAMEIRSLLIPDMLYSSGYRLCSEGMVLGMKILAEARYTDRGADAAVAAKLAEDTLDFFDMSPATESEAELKSDSKVLDEVRDAIVKKDSRLAWSDANDGLRRQWIMQTVGKKHPLYKIWKALRTRNLKPIQDSPLLSKRYGEIKRLLETVLIEESLAEAKAKRKAFHAFVGNRTNAKADGRRQVGYKSAWATIEPKPTYYCAIEAGVIHEGFVPCDYTLKLPTEAELRAFNYGAVSGERLRPEIMQELNIFKTNSDSYQVFEKQKNDRRKKLAKKALSAEGNSKFLKRVETRRKNIAIRDADSKTRPYNGPLRIPSKAELNMKQESLTAFKGHK